MTADPLNTCVRIWAWADAPEELRAVFGGDTGDEELLIHVPPGALDEKGNLRCSYPALTFLNFLPKEPGLQQYAGDDFGWYSLVVLPDGGRVVMTCESVPWSRR